MLSLNDLKWLVLELFQNLFLMVIDNFNSPACHAVN